MGDYAVRYDLMTLDVSEMLEYALEEYKITGDEEQIEKTFTFDLNSAPEKKRILKETNTHADNAMFFQIRECLKRMGGYKAPKSRQETRNLLRKSIVYLDFSKVEFPKAKAGGKGAKDAGESSADRFMRLLFIGGFELIFEEEECRRVHFMPFDKSASMSRRSMMTFVDRELLHAENEMGNLEKRITLDMDMKGSSLSLSKYFAYRGLYLTDAKRIKESQDFPLNEETVVVLANDSEGHRYINHKKMIDLALTYDTELFLESGGLVKRTQPGPLEERIQEFDGEGLISPRYAQQINRSLFADSIRHNKVRQSWATSFQIRMPFTKGMLHQVDYHAFMLEFTQRDDLTVRDAFGINRDLSKAEVILTTSMFKCYGWLEKYCANQDDISDPMQFYFEKFHKYNHALYVGNTNLNNPLRGTVKLNYQFLNTLALDEDTMAELVADQVALSDAVIEDPTTRGRNRLLRQADPDETDSDGCVITDDVNASEEEGDAENPSGKAWCYALQKNPAFVRDPFIMDLLKSESLSMLKNIAGGRIEVSGALEYLSGDLFALLIYMILISNLDQDQKDELYKELRTHTLYEQRFYMADAEEMGISHKKYYALFRSPHLSRNEQCALRPYIPRKNSPINLICRSEDGKPMNVYRKYFSHLKGVLMVGYSSEVALTLGGADFDGDYVKIVTDPRITEAVLQGAYEQKQGMMYDRKLAVPVIRAAGAKATVLPTNELEYYDEMCRIAKDTFCNEIGRISNKTIELGRREYYGDSDLRKAYAGRCALSTITTGLEIDAVKTGIHPIEAEKDELSGVKSVGHEYIDRLKTYITPADSGKIRIKKAGDGFEVSGFGTGRRKLTVSATEYDDKLHSNIDYLPYWYFEALYNRKMAEKEKAVSGRRKDQNAEPLFSFELGEEYRNPDEKKKQAMKELIATYKKVIQKSYINTQSKHNGQMSRMIANLHQQLRKQYDYDRDVLPETQCDFHYAVEFAYEDLKEVLMDLEHSKEIKENYHEYKHAYAIDPQEKWEGVVGEILAIEDLYESLSEETIELLLEPAKDGYRILFYLISAIRGEFAQEQELDVERELKLFDDAPEYDKGKKHYRNVNRKLYEEMLDIYHRAEREKKPAAVRKALIRELCAERMGEIFDHDMNEAMLYAYMLQKESDKNGSFFWNMFDVNTVADNLYYKEEDRHL